MSESLIGLCCLRDALDDFPRNVGGKRREVIDLLRESHKVFPGKLLESLAGWPASGITGLAFLVLG
jgi:hypothetical protein